MMEQGLFQQFPCDEIYGMYNSPNGKPGRFEICKGRAMAGAAFFDIVISGLGSHAAMPQQSRDPVTIAAALVGQVQSIISRNVAPLETSLRCHGNYEFSRSVFPDLVLQYFTFADGAQVGYPICADLDFEQQVSRNRTM